MLSFDWVPVFHATLAFKISRGYAYQITALVVFALIIRLMAELTMTGRQPFGGHIAKPRGGNPPGDATPEEGECPNNAPLGHLDLVSKDPPVCGGYPWGAY
ncbi:hypothetical protein DK37_19780 [Halomonas sp. SUBG004]|nr:hypothetical protein DK37_19780 [Halomonas sp. SUBG004]